MDALPKRARGRIRRNVILRLPDEFIERCRRDGVEPETVLRGFIADLCGIWSSADAPRADGYCINGSSESDKAQEYYDRVGYPYWNK